MRNATLCFVVSPVEEKILLGHKKIGFGQGKWNGFGGKIEQGEEIIDAALRELHEESSLMASPEHTTRVAELTFRFPSKPEWNQVVHVFIIHYWRGNPTESNEMKPAWFLFSEIPFPNMFKDDKYWLPLILQGKKLNATFVFDKDNETILNHTIHENP